MLDKKYDYKTRDAHWQKMWQEKEIYKFQPNSSKSTYSIDTPPPTVSGELHLGHIAGFSQADMLARFFRMQGYNLFYPLGFDNNGLPTELLVEKKRNIKAYAMPREEFTKIALEVVDTYNENYRQTMLGCGMSYDFSLGYNTIDKRSQQTSQKSFLELAKAGHAYREDKPSPWCSRCRTSVAAAELENEDRESVFNYLNFNLADGSGTIPIATTRPEFLPACVAIFVNPEDERYKNYVGKMVKVPLFEHIQVKVLTDEKVAIDKGTGVVMCCTFGDQTDVEWWKKYNLNLKVAITDDGKMTEICGKYAGLKTTAARQAIVADLEAQGYVTKRDPIVHSVAVHERCHEPIEFLAKKQWFIKTSTPELKQIWLERGKSLVWHPESMKARYDAWVSGLSQDWSISRQRYFGIPFPVWYCKNCGAVKFANEDELPVNPLSSNPSSACENCGCNEFEPETDVMDTWATSSVTPQINMDWYHNPDHCNKNMPMDMRFCGRDIINTWVLRTIIKAHYHQNCLPWKTLNVNGWVMADKGIKISKHLSNSKMNLKDVIANYGVDVVRYWCASGAYGRDVMFSDEGLRDGAKLVNKLWNASKFVLNFLYDYKPQKPETILEMDKFEMAKFDVVHQKFVNHFNNSEMGYAKAEIERFFWDFCDNYIEISKCRLYRPEEFGEHAKQSAQWACYNVLLGILKDFAIFMPHITEEIFQDYYAQFFDECSIHQLLLSATGQKDEDNLLEKGEEVEEIVSLIRKYKSENKLSLKTEVQKLYVCCKHPDFVRSVDYDIKAVGSVKMMEVESGNLRVDCVVGD